jgi:tRNA (guanosine-2'-O-)-methyltransferase
VAGRGDGAGFCPGRPKRYLTWTEAPTGAEAVDAARAEGWRIVGVELAESAVPLHEAVLGDTVCLAIGHEDRGLARAVLDRCDEVVFIPQLGRIGSLNVASAAAIALYEVRRREWSAELR